MKKLRLPNLLRLDNDRQKHVISILEAFEKDNQVNPGKNTPLDLFLRYYFLDNKMVSPSDRAAIVDYVYRLTSYKLYLSAISRRPINWKSRLEAFVSPKFEENFMNGQIPPHVRASFPEDLYNLMVEAYGEKEAFDMCHILNERPPLTVRANTMKITRHDLFRKFQKKKFKVEKCLHSPMGIQFNERPKTNFFKLPEYSQGFFEIQDEGSQLCAMRVDCKPGQTVLDYCGGAGGKTLAFAPFMHNRGQIFVHDVRKSVLLQAKRRFKRANLGNVQTHSEKHKLWQTINRKCHWVLADVPCTGTGTLRRNPDMKWKFSIKMLQGLCKVQEEIVKEVVPCLRKGGKLVYTTCSILPQENLMQVMNLCDKFNLEIENGKHFQVLPKSNGMDGFFSATLIKKQGLLID
ncbi:unnamed protein product [Moneuplotes crassus]|uniref:SAM-dependent MTase RsmB/NOP-type domain-containing protein n=1 Tax=Euplotes crassus TaxID=5936 RepID=A0AAD1XD87_EUPCR|nr:unnamed protein product [Moneuplotes crassus]